MESLKGRLTPLGGGSPGKLSRRSAPEFPAAHLLQSGEVPTSFKVAGCPLPVKWRAAYLPQSSDLPGGESGGRALCLRGSRPVMGPGATPAAMARAMAAGEHPSDAEATARKGRLNHTGTCSEGKTLDVTVSEGTKKRFS